MSQGHELPTDADKLYMKLLTYRLSSPLKPLGEMELDFIYGSPVKRENNFSKNNAEDDPRRPPERYIRFNIRTYCNFKEQIM